MRVYARFGDPRLRAFAPAKKPRPHLEYRNMSRRHLAYAVLLVASVVVGACSQPMAPVSEDTTCRGGVIVSSGRSCEGGE